MNNIYEHLSSESIENQIEKTIDDLCSQYSEFRKQWIDNNMCPCVNELLPNRVINCEHINRAIDHKFENEKNMLWNLTIARIKKSKNNAQLGSHFFDRIQV